MAQYNIFFTGLQGKLHKIPCFLPDTAVNKQLWLVLYSQNTGLCD